MHLRKLLRLLTKLCMIFFLMSVCSNARVSAQQINVPIRISEALTANTSGVSRVSEPVTLGIPLPDDADISSIDQLGVAGAQAYQFRKLDTWPSGNIKWVLVDFLANVAANSFSTYTFTAGSGAGKGPNLATDGSNSIWIDTGVMRVEILKKGFNLFNQVLLGDQQIISTNKSEGVVLKGGDGAIYSSKHDPSPKVTIEENGPVRAVIKAEGGHYAVNEKKLLEYTIRMHFYKGKSRTRLFYTLRNANRDQVINAGIQYLNLQIKTTIANGQFQFPTHNNSVSGNLSVNDSAAIYQAYSTYPQVIDWGFVSPIPKRGDSYEQEGYRVSKNLATLASGGRDSYANLFYCKLFGIKGAAVAGVRFAAGRWPKSLQIFADGTLSVGLWPQFNLNPTYIRFSSHDTYEVLFEFSKDLNYDAVTAMKKLQYPLVARTPVFWYNESQALYEKIVSFKDEAAYFVAQGWPATPRRPQGLQIYRYKYWGEGGGTNQYDFTRINLINFIRQEEVFGGEYFLMAEQRLQYNADWAVYHSDNFDPGRRDVPALQGPWGSYLDWPAENEDKVSTPKVIFEMEHRHWYGMTLYYYMTGDERFKDAIYDWGEYLITGTKSTHNFWMRALAWNIFGLTELFRFTHDQKYLDLAKQLFLDEIYKPEFAANQKAGFDRARGYFVDRNNTQAKSRTLSIFMHSAILYRALQLLYDELSDNDPAKANIGDILIGMSWFTYHELWFEYGKEAGSFGYPYRYDLDQTPLQDVRKTQDWYGGMREIFEVLAKGFELTGDVRFLTRIQQTLKNAAYNPMGTYWYQDYPGIQQMLYVIKNRASLPGWQTFAITARRNGDSTYTLSWIVPKGARRIQVKYSEKQLVEWLGFDRGSRGYKYDPAVHQAYFAAADLPGIPKPASAGTQQSIRVSNLNSQKDYEFMAKVYIEKSVTTDVDNKSKNSLPPAKFRLLQNYPNPFNPDTTIPFELPRESEVTAKVFNTLGEEVSRLIDQPMTAGSHLLKWDGRDGAGKEVATGIYFLKIKASENIAVRKMLLVR